MPKLYRKARGKEEVVEVDGMSKLRNRLIQLRKSTMRGCSGRGKKYPVTYWIGE